MVNRSREQILVLTYKGPSSSVPKFSAVTHRVRRRWNKITQWSMRSPLWCLQNGIKSKTQRNTFGSVHNRRALFIFSVTVFSVNNIEGRVKHSHTSAKRSPCFISGELAFIHSMIFDEIVALKTYHTHKNRFAQVKRFAGFPASLNSLFIGFGVRKIFISLEKIHSLVKKLHFLNVEKTASSSALRRNTLRCQLRSVGSYSRRWSKMTICNRL